jgi:RNA polymerase sigma factor (sigma-70 family)
MTRFEINDAIMCCAAIVTVADFIEDPNAKNEVGMVLRSSSNTCILLAILFNIYSFRFATLDSPAD